MYCLKTCTAAAAAAESLSRVQLCATPQTAAHQAPPSLGFSRQEHWSGLPLPSPMHESEKWKGRHSVVSDSSWPHGLQPTRLLNPWDFPGKNTGVGCHCLLWKIRTVNLKPWFSSSAVYCLLKGEVLLKWERWNKHFFPWLVLPSLWFLATCLSSTS